MIKGLGFSKYLKLSLIGFGISFFMGFVVNSVSAVDYSQLVPVSIDKVYSNWSSNYQIGILNKARFNTLFLGSVTNTLTLSNGFAIFWAAQGDYINLYYINSNQGVSNLTQGQGFFQYYKACDKIDLIGSGYSIQNCTTPVRYSPGDEILSNFISKIQVGTDYVYLTSYYSSTSRGYGVFNLEVCFSSSYYNQTLCFVGNQTHDSQYPNRCAFSGSLDIPYDFGFGDLRYIASDSPAFSPNIDGGSQDVLPGEITGDVMNIACTKRQALEWYRNNYYTDKMCYSLYSNNTDLFSGGVNYSAGFDNPGTDIWSIYVDSKQYRRYGQTSTDFSYSDWFSYWRKSYEIYKQNNENGLSNPFQGVPVSLFTLMGFVDTNALPFSNSSVLEYCDLAIYSDGIDLSEAYSGVAYSAVCSKNNGIGSSWDGITNRPGYNEPPVGAGGNENSSGSGGNNNGNNNGNNSGNTFSDGKTFQNDFFNMLSKVYRYPTDSHTNGILPSYLIIALCCLIFFRFLRH